MHDHEPSDLEPDPRFPSGPWTGFFLQRLVPGRHLMELRLTFQHGTITGEGRDWVGEFLVRGKYAKRIRESTNVVVLDPQVAKAFPNDEAVNNALRGLIRSNRSDAKLSTKRKSKLADKKRAA